MKYEIELTTMHDVQEFNKIVSRVDCDVRLKGKDEHGADWGFPQNPCFASFFSAVIFSTDITLRRILTGTRSIASAIRTSIL